MKNVTFKKTYVADTTFTLEELTWFIGAAQNNEYASFKDKNQLEEILSDPKAILIDIFEKENYRLEYLGQDSLNSNHLFNITNGIKTIEIIMLRELFSVHFQVS